MMTVDPRARMIFETIGYPIGSGRLVADADEIDAATEYVFKSRVGLLFLNQCVAHGAVLTARTAALHEQLIERSRRTRETIARLANVLNGRDAEGWVLFKSLKPFPSTPNDTDWFPLDRNRHQEFVDALIESEKFELLERAPLQTTLIEVSGRGHTDTTKKGGIYYIDCYQVPSTDYFVYLDTSSLAGEIRKTLIDGVSVPVLSPAVELFATMYHNVFPERSFSIESYYLIKEYMSLIASDDGIDSFVELVRKQAGESAVRTNLSLVRSIDATVFNISDPNILALDAALGQRQTPTDFAPLGKYPYEIPSRLFWSAFFSKLRNKVARKSAGVQFLHMLNPAFFVDVVRIVYRRAIRGGVYEQN